MDVSSLPLVLLAGQSNIAGRGCVGAEVARGAHDVLVYDRARRAFRADAQIWSAVRAAAAARRAPPTALAAASAAADALSASS